MQAAESQIGLSTHLIRSNWIPSFLFLVCFSLQLRGIVYKSDCNTSLYIGILNVSAFNSVILILSTAAAFRNCRYT